jgi:hypothetical protein
MKVRFQADADLNAEIVAGVLRREPSTDFQTAAPEHLGERISAHPPTDRDRNWAAVRCPARRLSLDDRADSRR